MYCITQVDLGKTFSTTFIFIYFFEDKQACKAEYSLIKLFASYNGASFDRWACSVHNKQRAAVHLSCCEVWHLYIHPQGDTVT